LVIAGEPQCTIVRLLLHEVLFAVLDDEALEALADLLTSEVVDCTIVSLYGLNSLDSSVDRTFSLRRILICLQIVKPTAATYIVTCIVEP